MVAVTVEYRVDVVELGTVAGGVHGALELDVALVWTLTLLMNELGGDEMEVDDSAGATTLELVLLVSGKVVDRTGATMLELILLVSEQGITVVCVTIDSVVKVVR